MEACLIADDSAVMSVLFVVFGVDLLGDGVAILAGSPTPSG